ncbi:MAG: hypothetical protein RSB55_09025 [Oscillospiraceae bacterium]
MDGRTEYRIKRVLARTKKLRHQRERRLLGGLSALCLLLTVGLAALFGAVTVGIPYGSPVTGTYAAVLLHEGAGGYVLVGVLAFSIGALITVLCLWWHKRH